MSRQKNSEQLELLMMDYLSGKMSASEQQQFQCLLASHPEHSQELLELEHMLLVFDQHQQQPVPKPSSAMDDRFYGMLHEHIHQQQVQPATSVSQWHQRIRQWFSWQSLKPIGFAFSMLAVGVLIGQNRQLKEEQQQWQANQVDQQQQQIQALTVLAMLDMPSANKRMMALNLAAMTQQPGESLIEALLITLKQDNNVNVRLQALDTLTTWINNDNSNSFLRNGLVSAIDHQQSPMVQIAMADLMQRIGEPQAVKPLQKLLEQEPLIEPVREKLTAAVDQLI